MHIRDRNITALLWFDIKPKNRTINICFMWVNTENFKLEVSEVKTETCKIKWKLHYQVLIGKSLNFYLCIGAFNKQ